MFTRGFRTLIEHRFCCTDLHGRGEDLLLNAVMQFSRQPVALLQGCQILFSLQQMLELLCHTVELLRQLADLICRSILDECREIPLAPRSGRQGDCPQSFRKSAGSDKAKDGANDTSCQSENDQAAANQQE